VKRTPLLLAAALGLLAAGLADPGRADDKAGWTPQFNGRDFTGWKIYLRDANADPHKTFSVKDGVIHCTGQPLGYLRTEKEYGDYELRVQWRWPEDTRPNANSGVFVHVVGPDKIWPKAIEAQLATGRAGDIWLVDGFKMTIASARDPRSERHYARIGDKFVKREAKDKQGRDQYEIVGQKVEKPHGDWNQYEITCRGNTVKLVVNGHLANEGTDAELTKGNILLQSEGFPIEFRNVEIKMLK
jgi:hypothetical protein